MVNDTIREDIAALYPLRQAAVAALDASGLTEQADQVQSLPPIEAGAFAALRWIEVVSDVRQDALRSFHFEASRPCYALLAALGQLLGRFIVTMKAGRVAA